MSTLKRFTASVAALSVAMSIVSPVAGVSAAVSGDVEAANRLAEAGIISDQSANSVAYRLGDNITRGEMAKVQANLAEISPNATCKGLYTDVTAVTPNTWVCGYVEALREAGMLSPNTTFRPNDKVTKAEALKMVMSAKDIEVEVAEGQDWRVAYMEAGVEANLTESFSDFNGNAIRDFVFTSADSAVTVTEKVTEDCDLECQLMKLLDSEETDSEDVKETSEETTSEETTSEETTSEETTSEETTSEETNKEVIDGELEVTLSPLSPTGNVAAGTTRTTFMVIDVTAGDEDVELDSINLEYTGLSTGSDLASIALYNEGTKVTKGSTKTFGDDLTLDLTFDKDLIVEAGTTKTFELTATVANGTNVVHQVTVVDIESSASYIADEISSASFGVVSVTNKTELDIDNDKATDDVVIGEESKLAGFKLDNTTEKEDAIVKNITFSVSGSVDVDDISNLVLKVDNEEVATDLEVNSDDEVVVNTSFVIPADKKVVVELFGTLEGSVSEDIQVEFADAQILAVGARSGVNLTINDTVSGVISEVLTIEGSAINVSFERASQDEVKPGAEDVLVGTLKLSSVADYEINSINVEVTASTGSVSTILKNIELDGTSYDSDDSGTGTVNYTFEDISLDGSTDLELPLTIELEDSISTNPDLTFDVTFVKITDEDNDDQEYTSGTLKDVLSTTTFSTKTISVAAASFELTANTLTDRTLVLSNGSEVVLFSGKAYVGDSDSVVLDEMTFTGGTTSLSGSLDLTDVIDTVTLKVGDVTVKGDVSASQVEFTSANIKLEAGADAVQVLVTAVLKDNDSVVSGNDIQLALSEVVIEDSEGDELADANIDTTDVSTLPRVVLNTNGSVTFAVVTGGDYEDSIDAIVLAGTNSVNLAEIEAEAEDEDINVEEVVFTITGTTDYTSTFDSLRIINAETGKTLVSGGTATMSGSNTVITFDDDFTLLDSENEVSLLLVADLNIVTTAGGVQSATVGDIAVELTSIETEGDFSKDDITADTSATEQSDAVTVVPAKITVSLVDKLGTDDKTSEIRFTIDKGNNDLDNDDITVVSMSIEDTITGSGITIRNDDGEDMITSATGTTFSLTGASNSQISNNDTFTIRAVQDDSEVRISSEGITYYIGTASGTTYTITNDSIIDLGTYSESN